MPRTYVDVRNFEEGMEAGARRRTRRAADEYANTGNYEAAASQVIQTDPELSQRYRTQGAANREAKIERAEDAYRSEVAPMIARQDYDSAIETAGRHGRPGAEIGALREALQNANEDRVREAQRLTEQTARSLLGIAELDPSEQQAAFTQWRSSLPPESQAGVPEQFSVGYVRRRLREAQTIQQYITDVARQRGFELTQQRLQETERHNRESEAIRRNGSGRRRPYTEFASTSASYANRAAAADATILNTPDIDWGEVWGLATVGGGTPTSRQVRQAMREFINVRNRRESGAAISRGEWLSARMELFPVPGDDPQTIANKAAARERVIRGLIAMSQGAVQEYFPEMFAEGQRWSDMAGSAADVDYSIPDEDDPGDGVVDVSTPEEAQALLPGTVYRTPDGMEYTR